MELITGGRLGAQLRRRVDRPRRERRRHRHPRFRNHVRPRLRCSATAEPRACGAASTSPLRPPPSTRPWTRARARSRTRMGTDRWSPRSPRVDRSQARWTPPAWPPARSFTTCACFPRAAWATPATTIAGIDWVISNAVQYNIRVLNISLGTNSSDSYLTDPLCAAVRGAVAAGITVVVAAGNYGIGPDGTQIYGTISSPGDEPSAITVGSANAHDNRRARRRTPSTCSARAARRAAATSMRRARNSTTTCSSPTSSPPATA